MRINTEENRGFTTYTDSLYSELCAEKGITGATTDFRIRDFRFTSSAVFYGLLDDVCKAADVENGLQTLGFEYMYD